MITKKISISISAFSNHLAIFLWQLLFVREFITFSCFGLLKLAFQKNTIFFKWYLAIPYEASIRSQDSGETSYILFLAIIAFTLRYILLSRILKVSKTFHISWQFAQIFVFLGVVNCNIYFIDDWCFDIHEFWSSQSRFKNSGGKVWCCIYYRFPVLQAVLY